MAEQNQVQIDPNKILQLVALLLPIVLQYGIPLVEKVIQSVKEDPNLPADVELLKAKVMARLEEASKLNSEVIAE